MTITDIFKRLDEGKTAHIPQRYVLELMRRLEKSGLKSRYALSVECENGWCKVRMIEHPAPYDQGEGIAP